MNVNWQNRTNEEFGPQHFYTDCRLYEKLSSDSLQEESEVAGSTDVANHICKTIREHNLIFSPNLTPEGVRGKVDSHGLCIVEVHGSLHQPGNCCGVFQHEFGLAQEPLSNIWKIKFIKILMKASSPQTAVDTNTHLTIEGTVAPS